MHRRKQYVLKSRTLTNKLVENAYANVLDASNIDNLPKLGETKEKQSNKYLLPHQVSVRS